MPDESDRGTIINIERAEALHVELLQNLPGTGDATSALSEVIKAHEPVPGGAHASCEICLSTDEEGMIWPCVTIAIVNAYVHVDGIPLGAEAWWKQP